MTTTLRYGAVSSRTELVDDDADAVLAAAAVVDAGAFSLLYSRHLEAIYRHCLRRLGSREEAEDVTSLVFIKALTSIGSFDPHRAPFRVWLFTIAHNALADAWRGRPQPSLNTDELSIEDPAPTPERVLLDDEEVTEVRALLSKLTVDQAQVVELRLAGLSGTEIAAVLGRAPNTVKVTQYRAYSRLRALLTSTGAGDGY
jgi:RNA polymerase sigma-70 factor (ECF subfamily)